MTAAANARHHRFRPMEFIPKLWEITATLAVQAARSGVKKATGPSTMVTLVRQFGGFALIPLAVLDSSIVPTFGSLDLLTAWLAAGYPKLWWYYALMSSGGSLLGAVLMYRLGKKMESLWIEKKIGARKLKKISSAVEQHGFGAIFVSAIAPPPFPTSWFFVVGGALSVSRKNFISATVSGRLLRYGLLTLVAAHYGRHFLRYLRHPLHYVLISIIVTASLAVAAYLFGKRKESVTSKAPHGVESVR
jgi:membrane protein YqaA with SNARE-associated domain